MPGSDELYNDQTVRFQGHRSRASITAVVRLQTHNLSRVQLQRTNYFMPTTYTVIKLHNVGETI